MKVLHIALRSLTLHSSVTHNVGACTNAGTNVGVTVADARVSAEEVERGFVSDGSKKTYHEKLAQFTFYLALNLALNAYICSHFRRAIWPKEHRQNN